MIFRFAVLVFILLSQIDAYAFGFVAISKSGAYGWAMNYLEYAQGRDSALYECKRNGGEECYIPIDSNEVEMHAVPGMSVYVARSDPTVQNTQVTGLGYSFDENLAKKRALSNCKRLSKELMVNKHGHYIKASKSCTISAKLYNEK